MVIKAKLRDEHGEASDYNNVQSDIDEKRGGKKDIPKENESKSSAITSQKFRNQENRDVTSSDNRSNAFIHGVIVKEESRDDKNQTPTPTKRKGPLAKTSSMQRSVKRYLKILFHLYDFFQRKEKKCMNIDKLFVSFHYTRFLFVIACPVLRTRIGDMQVRDNRLSSFEILDDILISDGNQPIENIGILADSGFYYCHCHERVKCYACEIEIPIDRINSTELDHRSYCSHVNEDWMMDNTRVAGQMHETTERILVSPNVVPFSENRTVSAVGRHYAEQPSAEAEASAAAFSETLRIGSPNDTQEGLDVGILHRRQRCHGIDRRLLLEENRRLRYKFTCKICEARRVKVVFLPCGHLVSCGECSAQTGICPICWQGVTQRIRVIID